MLAFVVSGVALIFCLTVYRNYRNMKSGTFSWDFSSGSVSAYSSNANLSYDDIVKPTPDNDPLIGPKDAKVTVIAFEDFTCPYCKDEAIIFREVIEQYKDRVLFVYRDFPLPDHTWAQKAAEAAECANDEGLFWYMHDSLFLNQESITSVDSLVILAGQLGMDETSFRSCLENGDNTSEVSKDFQDGVLAGVGATPTFFLNGHKIAGLVTKAYWEKALNYLLAN